MSIELDTEATNYRAQVIGLVTDDACCGTGEGHRCPEQPKSFMEFLSDTEHWLQRQIKRESAAGRWVILSQLELVRRLVAEIEQGRMPEPRCGYRFMDLVASNVCDPTMRSAKKLWDVYECICADLTKGRSRSEQNGGQSGAAD